MSDPDDWLVLTPDNLGFAILNPDRSVAISLDLGRWQEFVGKTVAIRMSHTKHVTLRRL